MRKVAGNGLECTVGQLTRLWGITMVILGVILRVVYVILIMMMILMRKVARNGPESPEVPLTGPCGDFHGGICNH